MHHAAHARGWAHRIANFRGLRARTGKRKKHTMKHVAAPRLQAVKARRRSQRDTTDEGGGWLESLDTRGSCTVDAGALARQRIRCSFSAA